MALCVKGAHQCLSKEVLMWMYSRHAVTCRALPASASPSHGRRVPRHRGARRAEVRARSAATPRSSGVLWTVLYNPIYLRAEGPRGAFAIDGAKRISQEARGHAPCLDSLFFVFSGCCVRKLACSRQSVLPTLADRVSGDAKVVSKASW